MDGFVRVIAIDLDVHRLAVEPQPEFLGPFNGQNRMFIGDFAVNTPAQMDHMVQFGIGIHPRLGNIHHPGQPPKGLPTLAIQPQKLLFRLPWAIIQGEFCLIQQ